MHPTNPLSILASLMGIPMQELELKSKNLMGGLGMDSLTATRVRAALIPQPSYQVLYGLTVEEVAAILVDSSLIENTVGTSQTENSSTPFHLTAMQESYLLGTNQGYPCQVYSEFDIENLHIDTFQKAVQSVIDQHPMLHATIVNNVHQAVRPSQERSRLSFELITAEDLNQRREECIKVFQKKPDMHWNIQFTKLDENKVRLHLLLDMLFIDATSAMILFHEVATAYGALLNGNLYASHVDSPLEFWDYCNQLNSKQISASSLQYWEERFPWMPGPPQLPRLKDSSDQRSHFQRLAFNLEEAQWNSLKTYALQLQITPNALLLSIFSEVLRFYAEEPDFSITVTMSERPVNIENNFSGVVGEFTNILLCPMIGQNASIGASAQKIHQELCSILEHTDFSGLEVIRKLRKYRSNPHLSFPIVFTSFIGVIRHDIELVDCKTTLHFQQTQTPQITLDHQVYEWHGKLFVNWDYDNTVYDTAVMADMLSCFHHLLQQVAKDHECLPSLPPEVIEKRLSINQTHKEWDPSETFLLHDLFFKNLHKHHNSIAIIDQELKFTYQEIHIISRAIATALQQKGIGPDCCVAVVMEKGWEQIVATLGILLTGAFYLPLDASHPDERLRYILTLANCKLALIQPKIMATERTWWNIESDSPLVTIAVHRDLPSVFSDQELIPVHIEPDQLAYVIFTSGSTGEPKGVEISHRSAVNTCLDINERFGLQQETVVFAMSALNFDLSVWDIFGTLGAGGTLVMCKPEGTRDPGYWWEQLQQHHITIWNTVPTSFEMLMASRPPSSILSLKVALLSGDAISMNMLHNARVLFPDLKIIALGGATEASIWSNFHVIENHSWDLNTDLAPYGKPLSNQTMHVLDAQWNYRPDRVVGDIYIGGTGLARGYFKDNELTASKFPIVERFGRLYATGDLGRYLPNGEIEILGRKDSQVKIGGYRVELAEIERCVERLIFVNKSTVIHFSDSGDRLIGFVIIQEAPENWEEQIHLHTEQHLPHYMVPQVWINLEQMPLTQNNKIDIKKLRQIAGNFLQQQDTPLEENRSEVLLILQIAAQLIGVPSTTLSPIHSLMEQGLSSLLVVQFINLLSAAWNTRLSYTLVFNYPSAVKLAHFSKTLTSKEMISHPNLTNTSPYSTEPIAIIGVACRVPGGVSSPEEFWSMLLNGTNCVTNVPTSRFDIKEIYHPDPNKVGYSYTCQGAFIEEVDHFDYGFFNIPIAEASAMDPQQRLFLEVAYEAFYTAGYDKERLKGSLTGIFVGQMNYDWMTDFHYTTDYAGTVVAPSITSNRISFILDLAGPSMTIDTACSSSLVAVDAAITKLRAGACSMALAGGINLILCATPYITTCQARMLSINSRCATFDAAADGIVRGEGAGAVVLKRLSDAQAAGDPIFAIIRGSCVNQDGKSASLTAPSGLAQQAVIQAALADAGIAGRDIDYVECHGTGTPLGDPIEVESLKHVLNDQRTKPVVLGAIKTNIGHLEGAAGIIGLIKTIEVLRHRRSPPNLHFQHLNPKIDLQGFPALLPSKSILLGRENKENLMAGVSSFGYGGTNAHLILQSWDTSNTVQARACSNMLWMFTGQGSITAGNARFLYEENRFFKEALDQYTSLFENDKGISLLKLLIHEDPQGLLQHTQYGQPALVALQLAQINMWQARGVIPRIVLGHSIGEFAAAVVAGIMRPETAFTLSVIRGKLMEDCPPGSMAAVFLGVDILQPILPKEIFVSAENGPSMTVLSGDQACLREFLHMHLPEGNQYVFLPVSHAFHSPFMIQASEAFREHIKSIELFEPTTVQFISTLTGELEISKLCTADYWVDQIVNPVHFLKAVTTTLRLSPQLQTVIEVGPSSTLINMAKRFVSKEPLKWIPSHEASKHVPKHYLFRQTRLPWDRPIRNQNQTTLGPSSLENCIYETIWTPLKDSSTGMNHVLLNSCLVLSCIEIDLSLPSGWLMVVISEEETLLKNVSQKSWDAVILLCSGSQRDVELGLRLLQFAGQNTTLLIGDIFFATPPSTPLAAGLWGLARTVHQERPDIDIHCIECKAEELVKAVLLAIQCSDEKEFSFSEQEGLKLPRIARCSDILSPSEISIHPEATYIISGGQGALGLITAKVLADGGAKYLLLLSRNPQPVEKIPQLVSLRNQTNIQCLACDVSQKEHVIKVKDWLVQEQWPAVRGIVHTAGVLTDGTLPNQSESSIGIAFGAKVEGACHLRSIFSPPDFLLLFSSIAALFGSAGQASYAAANAALDAFALQWASAGEPVLSIQWGPWSEVGMAVRQDTLKRTEMLGFGIIHPSSGAALLNQLIASHKRGTVCVSPIRWEELALKDTRFRNLQHDLPRHPQTLQQWDLSAIQKLVRDCILLFIPSSQLEGNPSFMEAGLSSLDLVQFRQQLMSRLPSFVELPVHFAFNYPTEQDVVDYLTEQLAKKTPEKKEPPKIWTLLNEKKYGAPIFLISGVVGTVEKTFGTLAAAVSRPVYAMKPAIPAYIDREKITLETIAEGIKESMFMEIPLDTYVIGGLSFGATLALEVGLQIEKEGKLSKLVMIDPRHMPPFKAPTSPAPFEILLEHYTPSEMVRAPTLLFQCAVPPIEKQSEMMLETSRSFQDDETILNSCQRWCQNLDLIRTEGHHFNLLYKHAQPIAARIEQSFQARKESFYSAFNEPIAIVSAACRLPGNIRSLEEFWKALIEGKDCVTEIPYSRFEIEEVYNPNPDILGCSYTRSGAFMEGVEYFDHEFFGISVAEARVMDPQQRLLVEVAYEALYRAGYDKSRLRGSSTGVYIGLANDDWTTMGRDQEAYSPYFSAGTSGSIVSNRLSYLFGLTGPSMAIDTACSSSLVAVDLAVEKLRQGICSLAVVGGVNVMLHHRMFVSACATKALSRQGYCATFDASADGYCRGEGVGVIVLKRLSEAQSAGDPILAVIRGTAVNQDGRTVSLTAPNGLAQEAVILQALTAAGMKGHEIDYIECHGTGTPLGDPIEVASLKNVLNKTRKKPLILGAVKTNIGHLEGAAGVIGLIKAIEVIRHRQAPSIVHFKRLNPAINLEGFNIIIPTQATPINIPTNTPIRAGVSSFGFGGTNAHVILESYDNTLVEQQAPPSYHPRFLPWHRLPHPFLGCKKDEHDFVSTLSGERAAIWQDHCIDGKVLIPAASHITLFGGAALLHHDIQAMGIEIHDITFSQPLIVNNEPKVIHCSLRETQWILHDHQEEFANCQNTTILSSNEKIKSEINVLQICNRCVNTELEPLYAILAQQGVTFGPRYRNLTQLFLGEDEAIARVRIKPLSAGERALTLLHPATLDAGIQLLGLCGMKTCGVCVPFHIETAYLFSLEDQPEELWAYVNLSRSSSKSIEGNVTLLDDTGRVLAILERVTCRRFGTDTQLDESLFETEWVPLHPLTKPSLELPLHVLVLSRIPLDIAIPDTWRTLLIQDGIDLFSLLHNVIESQIVLLSGGVRADVELGLQLLQIISTDPSLQQKEVIFVTSPRSDADAGLWGLARTFSLERPDIRVRCFECTLNQWLDMFRLSGGAENELSLDQNNVVHVRRLRRFNQIQSTHSIQVNPNGTYIISGGQGALGIVSAQFLIEQGAKYLLLLSRTPKPLQAIPNLLELNQIAKIECLACDVSKEEDVQKACNWLLRHGWPKVQGIMHTAGVLTDGTIPNQSSAQLRLAFGPKVDGARHLRAIFRPSDFLVLFSSAAATFGSAGQASYAAANATLDALAENWAESGDPVLSIQWGAWSEVGMAVRHDAVQRAEKTGFGSISSTLGKAVLAHLLLNGKRGVVCVSPIDWSRLTLNIPLLSRFILKKPQLVKNELQRSTSYSETELVEIVRHAVKEAIGKEVAEDKPLMANGMDSLSAVVLAQTLSQKLGLSLGSVFALNYPTMGDMVPALRALLGDQPLASIKSQLRPIPRSEEPIAIVGSACRLPGNVKSVQAFWEMLLEGTNCVTEVPYSRFDIDEVYNPDPDAIGCSYTRHAAFMSDVEYFDCDFFDILVAEARLMDPHQRLLVETAYEAFYRAGYDKKRLRNVSAGVFVGVANQDWTLVCGDQEVRNPFFGVGVSSSIISNRISYLLGLTGPSMTLDTACSSSLVAVDLAVEKLRNGACSIALVGGVNIMLHHRTFVGCCSAKMLSAKGRCAALDASADGYCRGEGVGAVVLKRLSDAQADGDPILAVIRGTAVNQDGRSSNLTAPNGVAQEAVIEQALTIAGIEGRAIDYIECHGTGTSLGDPIEIAALKNVLGKGRKKPLILGAVKTNIGHLEGAAGIVGLIKAIEVLRHRQAPAIIHFNTLNPKIDLVDFNVIIPTKPIPFSNDLKEPVLAGVSSFGFGGTNAHVILESYDSESHEQISPPVYHPRFLPWRRLPHPCLSSAIKNGWKVVLSGERAAIWKDHSINGAVLMPGASHVTLLGGAALYMEDQQAIGVEVGNITMLRPLIVEKEPKTLCVIQKNQQWSLQNDNEQFASCQTSRLLFLEDKTSTDFDIQAICQRCTSIEIEPLYDTLSQQGMHFGPRYRNIKELFMGDNEGIARVQITSLPPGERSLTLIHPALLDAGIQLLGVCGMKTCGMCIPFHIGKARLFSMEYQPEELWAHAYVKKTNNKSIEGTLTLFDESGEVFAVLEDLTCRRLETGTQIEDVLFETEWSVLPTSTSSALDKPDEVILVSCTPCDMSLPAHWQFLSIGVPNTFLLPNSSWSQLILSIQEKESDMELALRMLQQLIQNEPLENKSIVFVIPPKNLVNAGLWGLVRSFRLEYPNIKICCVESTLEHLEKISSLSKNYPYENEFRIDAKGILYAKRLCRSKEVVPSQSIIIRSDATYVISGGQGALGLIMAQCLIEEGARYLLLLSRTPQPIENIPELLKMSKNARIECLAADVADEQTISKIHDWLLNNQWPTVQGIIHTAGVLTDGTIPNQSIDKIQDAFKPKVQGALHLHQGFPSVDFFIMFSSAAATFGSIGQASYAAANSALDALAEHWAEDDQPVLSIQWGAWSEAGMAVRHNAVQRAEAAGFGSITSDLGKAILVHLLHKGTRGVVCASPIDWSTLQLNTPLTRHFLPERKDSMNSVSSRGHQYNEEDLLTVVRQAVKTCLGKTVSDDVPLMASGLDSLSAVILAQTLSQKIGLSLGSVFALNYPTIAEMVKALLKQTQKSIPQVNILSRTPSHLEDPIVVVSAACRLPGNVTSPDEFWEMLMGGTDCVTDIPSSRFDISPFYDPNPNSIGRSYTRKGAFMSQVESFDHEFFGIPIVEARSMDPQQRLLLEVAYEAFYAAGYERDALYNLPIAVFIGQMNQDWAHMHTEEKLADPYFGAGSSPSITSNRISYLLGLTGPSMTLDTACSSSLVAVDLAVEKLRNGMCSAALVGGVNVMLSHRSFVGCCSAKMLSFMGRCATFDISADGYCRGEGVGAVVLKRMKDAEADGNEILAIIRGTAVNQDGRSASLTAPNGLAQEAVIKRALEIARLKGSDVDYIECHGTGTPLGDPIEVGALKNVLNDQRKKHVVLGAVKTNIGHLEGAAGVIGLIKAIEVLRHRKAPGNVHFTTLNPKIDLTDFPAIISSQPIDFERHTQKTMIVGVSSFGFGGTNAHVILESGNTYV